MLKDDRKNVLHDAKIAVRAYAKDPSDTNAERVESAWQTVKHLQAAAVWRQPDKDKRHHE